MPRSTLLALSLVFAQVAQAAAFGYIPWPDTDPENGLVTDGSTITTFRQSDMSVVSSPPPSTPALTGLNPVLHTTIMANPWGGVLLLQGTTTLYFFDPVSPANSQQITGTNPTVGLEKDQCYGCMFSDIRGGVFVASLNIVYFVAVEAGQIGLVKLAADAGMDIQAALGTWDPQGVSIDPFSDGGVLAADTVNNVIIALKRDLFAGLQTTVCVGGGTDPDSTDLTTVQLQQPHSLVAVGNFVYFTELGNGRLRKYDATDPFAVLHIVVGGDAATTGWLSGVVSLTAWPSDSPTLLLVVDDSITSQQAVKVVTIDDTPSAALPASIVGISVSPGTFAPPTPLPSTATPPTPLPTTSEPPTPAPTSSTLAPPTPVPTTSEPPTAAPTSSTLVPPTTSVPTAEPPTQVITASPIVASSSPAPTTSEPATEVPLASTLAPSTDEPSTPRVTAEPTAFVSPPPPTSHAPTPAPSAATEEPTASPQTDQPTPKPTSQPTPKPTSQPSSTGVASTPQPTARPTTAAPPTLTETPLSTTAAPVVSTPTPAVIPEPGDKPGTLRRVFEVNLTFGNDITDAAVNTSNVQRAVADAFDLPMYVVHVSSVVAGSVRMWAHLSVYRGTKFDQLEAGQPDWGAFRKYGLLPVNDSLTVVLVWANYWVGPKDHLGVGLAVAIIASGFLFLGYCHFFWPSVLYPEVPWRHSAIAFGYMCDGQLQYCRTSEAGWLMIAKGTLLALKENVEKAIAAGFPVEPLWWVPKPTWSLRIFDAKLLRTGIASRLQHIFTGEMGPEVPQHQPQVITTFTVVRGAHVMNGEVTTSDVKRRVQEKVRARSGTPGRGVSRNDLPDPVNDGVEMAARKPSVSRGKLSAKGQRTSNEIAGFMASPRRPPHIGSHQVVRAKPRRAGEEDHTAFDVYELSPPAAVAMEEVEEFTEPPTTDMEELRAQVRAQPLW